MAKDYARKGKPVTRKKQAPQPAPKKNKTRFLLLIVLIVIGGFIAFLVSINGKAPEQVSEHKQTQPTKTEKPLPKLPKEKWEYVKELENKTIEVDVPERSNEPTRPYKLQCASLRSESQAEALKAKIAFSGFESVVKPTQGTTGMWYRVVLGPFDTKRQAEAARHKLQNNKINGCQISYWT
ncbi:SPOR domain-containing protein [Catenovulum sp. 2E275]|uniref:SPOR domain-containing protein n=1 Tax=Catenovulum sp. 2E275 TaxID=2980497 RepID=UPI0021D3ACD2|nr:SPOR domain-containing protein [Catenovulum sp. 2E275]MCU4677324.1 SPOR domain-containing protein [Catenovulum sp. 2E275]